MNNTHKMTPGSHPSGEISTGQINHLEEAVSRAVGLLSLLAAAATMDRSRHGPFSQAESDGIIGIAYATGAVLNLACDTIAQAAGVYGEPMIVTAGERRTS